MLSNFARLFDNQQYQPFRWHGHHRGAALLVHGFPGTPAEMRPLAGLLHDNGWTVEGILLPGFGTDIETLPQRRSVEWVQKIEQSLITLRQQYDPIILCGFSMGGALSIQVAAHAVPDALLLFAPFWKIDHFLWQMLPVLRHIFPEFKLFQLVNLDFDDPDVQRSIRAYMPDADLDDSAVRDAIRNFSLPTSILNEIRITGQTGYDSAARIHGPVLIVQGTEDDLVSPDKTRQLMRQFPGTVYYKEVPGQHELLNPTTASWQSICHAISDFTHHLTTGVKT